MNWQWITMMQLSRLPSPSVVVLLICWLIGAQMEKLWPQKALKWASLIETRFFFLFILQEIQFSFSSTSGCRTRPSPRIKRGRNLYGITSEGARHFWGEQSIRRRWNTPKNVQNTTCEHVPVCDVCVLHLWQRISWLCLSPQGFVYPSDYSFTGRAIPTECARTHTHTHTHFKEDLWCCRTIFSSIFWCGGLLSGDNF